MAVDIEYLHDDNVIVGKWSGTIVSEDLNVYFTEVATLSQKPQGKPVFSVQVLDNVTGIPANSVAKFINISRSLPGQRDSSYTLLVVDNTNVASITTILAQVVRCNNVRIVRNLDEALAQVDAVIKTTHRLS